MTVPTVHRDEHWADRPVFGEWPQFSAQVHGLTEPLLLETAEPAAEAVGGGLAPATCWHPPRPAQPGPIGERSGPGCG
ncbi:hypothetical protein ACFXB4_00385 [Streptomyces lavendulae]|uniref:hypothetical protein n=1 Tax=Streptomyces lavendulae TaxID=1914 RepID=UPI0036876558